MRIFTEGNCCGCGACVHSCPVDAISWTKNERGFLLPQIHAEQCVKCGKCISVCPFNDEKPVKNSSVVYAAVNKDRKQLKNSASGGAFSALASMTIDNGGYVFGCAYDGEMHLSVIGIDNKDEILRLQGSKYVQAHTNDSFPLVKEKLEEGKQVLFCSTPCFCAGLKKYLGREWENLITCEIICHGVPSQQVFLDYVQVLEKKYGGKITNMDFRNKKRGWGPLLKISYQRNGAVHHSYQSQEESSYYNHFWRANCYRESCYSCPYAKPERESDLTIGDFWGIGSFHPEISTIDGVSVILANTEKGRELLEHADGYLQVTKSEFAYACRDNGQLSRPSGRGRDNKLFWELYLSPGGYAQVEKDYTERYQKVIGRAWLKRHIPYAIKKVKRMIKK